MAKSRSQRKAEKTRRRRQRQAAGKSKREGGMRGHQVERLRRMGRRPDGAGRNPMGDMPQELLHNAGLEHNTELCRECRRMGYEGL